MALRLKNLDLNTDGMRGHTEVSLGDITATVTRSIFVAPVACRVDFIDLYNNQAFPPAAATASVTSISATFRAQINGTASIMAIRGNSANGALTSDAISANARWRMTPSANNSLTVGTQVDFVATMLGASGLSAVIVQVTYTPLIHRETR